MSYGLITGYDNCLVDIFGEKESGGCDVQSA